VQRARYDIWIRQVFLTYVSLLEANLTFMRKASDVWSDLHSLRTVSAWFQWVSIGLVFLSGLLQVGKYLVDRREKAISAAVSAELINPVAQPIRTASVTIEVIQESSDPLNTHFMDSGGYVAFGRGTDSVMVLSGEQSDARQTGKGEVVWRAVFNMDATDPVVGKTVRSLRGAEFLQIGFGQLPEKSHIIRGSAVVTINSAVRLELPIPEQHMDGDKIFVRDIARFCEVLR